MKPLLRKYRGATAKFSIERNGTVFTKDVKISESGTLGVGMMDTTDLKFSMKKYSIAGEKNK